MSAQTFKHSALALIAGALASIIAPPPIVKPSAWAAENVIVPDGPYKGQKWRLQTTPYFAEPLDFWADECPDNKAVFRKSKQIGASTLAIAACGFTIDVQPCDVFLIEPTEANLADFNSEKLQRTLDGSPVLAEKVFSQTARSGKGSTTYVKRYRGGSILMGISTSTADLRGKTRKKVIKDEASEYPRDLDGQGSPHEMIAGSYDSFLASGEWKELSISTPVIKGECYIDEEFEKGDQRYWHVPCPGCGSEFYFQFDRKLFRFNEAYPFKAHYAAPCCGQVIEADERDDLVRRGRWIATAPAPGKHRSYHFDSLSSPFVPWDVVAERWVAAKDNPAKQKTFDNLTLGLAHEVKGDAPDYVRLLERREDYPQGVVPARGLLLVAGADIQHSGIWYEVVAFAPNGESWSIQHDFLEGETTDPNAGAFARLAEIYDRAFPDSFNGRRLIDAMAVDAGDGGRANQVYAWSRSRARAFAIRGVGGWTAPAIGTPKQVDIHLSGKKITNGATLWPVGGWSLKATFYAYLGKDGRKAGQEVDPPGYCHHHQGCDERFFKQQTAEFLKTATFRGRTVKVWQETGPNHLLDCRIYAMAMAEYLGLSRLTPEEWAVLQKERGTPGELKEPDMLAPDSVKIAARPTILQRRGRKRRVINPGIR